MNCPNCGLANPDNAKFCANCGTSFEGARPSVTDYSQSQSQYQQPAYQGSGPYRPEIPARTGSSLGKNIAIGCLIAFLIFLFFGLSCTRACFGLRHRHVYVYRR